MCTLGSLCRQLVLLMQAVVLSSGFLTLQIPHVTHTPGPYTSFIHSDIHCMLIRLVCIGTILRLFCYSFLEGGQARYRTGTCEYVIYEHKRLR